MENQFTNVISIIVLLFLLMISIIVLLFLLLLLFRLTETIANQSTGSRDVMIVCKVITSQAVIILHDCEIVDACIPMTVAFRMDSRITFGIAFERSDDIYHYECSTGFSSYRYPNFNFYFRYFICSLSFLEDTDDFSRASLYLLNSRILIHVRYHFSL